MRANTETIYIAAGIGVALVVYWLVSRDNAKKAGAGLVNAAGNIAAGAVEESASWFGIPKTDDTECQLALAQGRRWDASFACPAGTFIKSWLGS